MLGQKDDERSGTGLLQTSSQFPLLTVVVKNNFDWMKIILSSIHIVCMVNFSVTNFGNQVVQKTRFLYVDTNNTFYNTESTTSSAALFSFQAFVKQSAP